MAYLLRHKTKDDMAPAQKQKVFYACTEQDFERSFNELSEDIFFIEPDCVILYLDSFGSEADDSVTVLKDDEELRAVLSGVQMVFVHVTKELLSTDNTAISLVIPYAKEHGIPIFPALTGIGFEDLYENSVLRGLQYRYKYDPSPGAVPYMKKLELYIRDHMLDSKQTERIKNEFRAMIFLSYRKKDRMSAQKLMRMIHQYKECEEIAIWYDEYLREGEDFAKGIRDILFSSDLLTLAVTPNLLEPGNYVMEIEYKEATQNKTKIPVFPVEMEKTDIDALRENFKGISDPVSSTDGARIRDYLSVFLSSHCLTPKENTPEHRYLMGLAYLDGIYVEVDKNKAIAFLDDRNSDASYASLEALARLYAEGNGVLQDIETTYRLQKAAEARLRRRSAEYAPENRFEYCRRMFDCCRRLVEYANTTNAVKAMNNAVNAAEEGFSLPAEEAEHTRLEEDCRLIRKALADAYVKLGKYSDADKQYRKLGEEYQSALSVSPGDDYVRSQVISNRIDRINLDYLTGYMERAFEDIRSLSEQLKDDPNTPRFDLLRIRCNLLKAKFFLEVNSNDDALLEVWDSVDLVEDSDKDLFEGFDEQWLKQHALDAVIETYLYSWYAAVVRGDGSRHPEWYKKTVELIGQYPKYRWMTAKLQTAKLGFYTAKAKMDCGCPKHERAEKLQEVYDSGDLDHAITSLEELSAVNEAPEETTLFLARANKSKALLCLELNKTKEALAFCDKAVRLCKNSPILSMRFTLIDVTRISAECKHLQGNIAGAIKELQSAYNKAKKIDRDYPSPISQHLLDTTDADLDNLRKNNTITTFRKRQRPVFNASGSENYQTFSRSETVKNFRRTTYDIERMIRRREIDYDRLNDLQEELNVTLIMDYYCIDDKDLANGAFFRYSALQLLYRHTQKQYYLDEIAYMDEFIKANFSPEAQKKYRDLLSRQQRRKSEA